VAVLAAAALAACGPKQETPHGYTPASLAPLPSATATLPGYGHVREVVLTPLAEQRLRVRTVTVAPGGGGQTQVPITAVIYDPEGVPWVYVPDGGHAYTRHAVTIARYVGDTVVLGSGPGAGTPVVVSGAAELLGTEYGVGEE
jgi:multidrug efflux pump subunit AcrA (membrane-fusion protein)